MMLPIDLRHLLDREFTSPIEIAGPTPGGYELFKDLNVPLPTNLVVTNVENPITLNPFGPDPVVYSVDEVLDLRSAEIAGRSHDLILASFIPRSDYGDDEPIELEYSQPLTPRRSLHLLLLRFAAGALTEDGLLVQVGADEVDRTAASAWGLRVVLMYENEDETTVYARQQYLPTSKCERGAR